MRAFFCRLMLGIAYTAIWSATSLAKKLMTTDPALLQQALDNAKTAVVSAATRATSASTQVDLQPFIDQANEIKTTADAILPAETEPTPDVTPTPQ